MKLKFYKNKIKNIITNNKKNIFKFFHSQLKLINIFFNAQVLFFNNFI